LSRSKRARQAFSRCAIEYGKITFMNVAFDLPPAQADRLQQEADRLGIGVSELARAVVSDLLVNRDEAFRAAAERVLPKNDELYRRLDSGANDLISRQGPPDEFALCSFAVPSVNDHKLGPVFRITKLQ
jgi:hypothetical protein